MATPSGQIAFSDVNLELGNSPTAQISMGSAIFRNLGNIISGQISMSNMRGKSNAVFTVSPTGGPGGSTWDPGTAFNITSGDYTLTAQQPYTFTAYIWGAGGSSSPTSSGGGGGFASATFSGSAGDVYVLKSNFGGGSSPNSTGGGGYGIFASSFTHANSRLIAGGGGGAGLSQTRLYGNGTPTSNAGGGGGTNGGNGATGETPTAANGGTSSAGGTAGSGGSAGSTLQGAAGGTSGSYYGGSGGGGYYGGGSHGTAAVVLRECADYQYSTCFQWVYNTYTLSGGGGGGSGYVHPSLSNSVNNGASGSTVAPSPASASPIRGTAGNVGQPGRIYLI